MKKTIFLLITIVFLLSEIILRVYPAYGLLCYSLLVIGMLIVIYRKKELDNYNKMIISLLILPAGRICEIFIDFSEVWKTYLFYYSLLFIVAYYSFEFKINIGIKKEGIFWLILAIPLGIFLGFLGNRFFYMPSPLNLLPIIPIVSFSEEILFRGLLQNTIKNEYGNFFGIVFPSLLYGLFSFGLGLFAMIFFSICNFFIGLFYNFRNNIFIPITINLCLLTTIIVL